MHLFGLSLHLQQLGSNVFLFQVLFGAVTLPANYVALLLLNHLGRRISQLLLMVLVGICILALIFVPQGKQRTWGGGGVNKEKTPLSLPHHNYLKLQRSSLFPGVWVLVQQLSLSCWGKG